MVENKKTKNEKKMAKIILDMPSYILHWHPLLRINHQSISTKVTKVIKNSKQTPALLLP
jgi:hypothetical protein